MSVKELERRVAALEEQLKQLQQERLARGRVPDWKAAVEKYKGDEDLLAVFQAAMKLREKERRAVHRKQPRPRRAKS